MEVGDSTRVEMAEALVPKNMELITCEMMDAEEAIKKNRGREGDRGR